MQLNVDTWANVSCANVSCVFMCQRALYAFVPTGLACLHAQVSFVLMCSHTSMPCMLICSCANMFCVLLCPCTNLLLVLTCLMYQHASHAYPLVCQHGLWAHVLMCQHSLSHFFSISLSLLLKLYALLVRFKSVINIFPQQIEFIYNPSLLIICRLKKWEYRWVAC